MHPSPKYSVIVPVYNRPEEIRELLESLTRQSYPGFEVIVVEDGSTIRCDGVVDSFREKLDLQYISKLNSGPGPSRNLGFSHAKGEFFVVFDSDCIIPGQYFDAVNKAFHREAFDAWGGPDRGHENFTSLQQAMGYTMSSVLTTGGIRGGKKHLGRFQPRSFNMGISRKVFETTGGFKFDRHAEDIELSIRMRKSGFRVILVPEAYVYHKRRTSLGQFYRQVSNFGKGRALIGKVHRGEIKITHWFPVLFLTGLFALPFLLLFQPMLFGLAAGLYLLYFLAIAIDAFTKTRSLGVSLLCIPSAFVQLFGYGLGFLKERLKPYM
jgi:glycosyltransferase involved in cell wall biosynthesis